MFKRGPVRAAGVEFHPRQVRDAPHVCGSDRSWHANDERAVGEVTILDLKGKITLNEGDEVLKDKINPLMQGKKKILLNLADVPYIDSAGLGEIMRTYTTVSRQGGQLKLVNLTKRITTR